MMFRNKDHEDIPSDELDVELGQFVPFCIEEFRKREYGFDSPSSSFCRRHCEKYDPDRCPRRYSPACLGSEDWRSVREVWDTVVFVPALLQVCREMRMPDNDLQHLFLQIKDKEQEDACEQIRMAVSWADLVDYARGSLCLRTEAEMTAIRAISGRITPIAVGDYSMKDIVNTIYALRRVREQKPTRASGDPDASYLINEEFEQAFQCPWSSPIWDAARKLHKGRFTPAFVVECPKPGVIRSALVNNWEKGAQVDNSNMHLFHPWFATDLLFVIDWDACPVKTEQDALESREVLALVVDLEKDNDYRLCVASLEPQTIRSDGDVFTNWICLETLAHIGEDEMWHKG